MKLFDSGAILVLQYLLHVGLSEFIQDFVFALKALDPVLAQQFDHLFIGFVPVFDFLVLEVNSLLLVFVPGAGHVIELGPFVLVMPLLFLQFLLALAEDEFNGFLELGVIHGGTIEDILEDIFYIHLGQRAFDVIG